MYRVMTLFQPVDVESLTITEKLKKGVKSFLKRAEDGKSLGKFEYA